MSPWPNCVSTAFKPAAPGLVVATMRGNVAQWQPAASILATDYVFTSAPYNGTTSDWWPSTSFTWTAPTVTPVALAGITISWIAPTQTTTGAPLTALAGYRIYENSTVITVANPATTSYTLPILPPGKYSLAVTSITTAGVESVRSVPFIVTIPAAGTQPVVQPNTVTCGPQS
jgi:hypothetical protein